ncbi:MAG TPA: LEA type 2 family protein [Accumulibacter sp.]|jgi:LEA14-like dessication related protein|nr:LEA type 2 family protein [Accumulibacter sp.]
MKKTLLLCMLLLLGGCAGLSGLTQKPELSVAGLQLAHLGLFEQRFALKLRVQNPNEVELPIDGLVFEIEVNGQAFVKGLSDKAVTVPRFGEAVIEVQATSKLANALKQWRELQKSGRERIDYRLFGRLRLAGIGNVPFDRRGDLPLPDASPK